MIVFRQYYTNYLEGNGMHKFRLIKLSTLIFLAGLIIILFFAINRVNLFLVNENIREEKAVIKNQIELTKMGNDLANASDYLTNEVRLFAITLDLNHVNNYWEEIYTTKTRNRVIEKVKLLDSPAEELSLLSEAKHNSDRLVSTEIRSMKLILTALEVPKDKMYPDVAKYILSEEDLQLSKEAKLWKAKEILFDETYTDAKASIMDPIVQFKVRLNERAENLEKVSAARANTIDVIQNIFSIVMLTLAVFLILLFFRLINKPIREYSEVIQSMESDRLKLSPSGVWEIQLLAEAFNTMQDKLEKNTTALMNSNQELNEAYQSLKEKNRQLEEATVKLDLLSKIDPLTSLFNRRHIMEKLTEESIRYERSKQTFSVIMADIDRFKAINDTYGHDCGDRILIELAKKFNAALRQQDSVARWGGEEFIFLLIHTDLYGAAILAEKIRQEIEESSFEYHSQKIMCTVTFGVAEYRANKELNETIMAADTALFEGKRNGRNRVELSMPAN